MSLFRKLLYSLMVISGLASTISAGTYASFNASTTSPSATFSTGSLVLDRQVTSGTTCISTGTGTTGGTGTDTNSNTTCTATLNVINVKPGDTVTRTLTITNAGTLPGTLYLASTSCTSGSNAGYWTAGTGNLCTSGAKLTIQETTTLDGTATSTCAFPDVATTCDIGAAGAIPSALGAAPYDAAPGKDLGSVAAGGARYFRVTMHLPSTLTDQFQGRRATYRLTWTLQ